MTHCGLTKLQRWTMRLEILGFVLQDIRLTSQLPRVGVWGVEIEFKPCGPWFTQLCQCNEALIIKTLDTQSSNEFPCWRYTLTEGWILRTWKLCIWDSPRPHPMHLFIWLVLICILYNKTIIISIVLFWVWKFQWITKPEGAMGTCSQRIRSVGGLGIGIMTSV
jgi:hypothetical protein